MKYTILILISMFFAMANIHAQSRELILDRDYIIEYDSTKSQEILKGEVNDQLLGYYDITSKWYNSGKKNYKPDSTMLPLIRKYLNQYEIYVFMGTWCGDTQEKLPEFMKILEMVNYPQNQLRIFAVDGNKKALNVENILFDIVKVPTIIFYKNNTEKARFIESSEYPLEEWMNRFLEKEEEFQINN